MFKLVISDDEGQKTVVPLLRDEVTIGREEGNTIRLTERNVSRSHARLRRRSDGYVVEDLGSYNGVVINGERIESEIKLSAGDRLGIGDYALAFESDAERSSRPPASVRPSAPPPRLVILGEPSPGAEFAIRQPVVRIGRDDMLDIPIYHKSVSHEHAEVQLQDGKVTIVDLESLNGIRVNGVQTSRAVLEARDEIEIGAVRLQFFAQEARTSLGQPPKVEVAPQETRSPKKKKRKKPATLLAATFALLLASGAAAYFLVPGLTEPEFEPAYEPEEDFAVPPAEPLPSERGEPGRVPGATDVYAQEPVPFPEPVSEKEAKAMIREAKASCRKALRTGDWEEALGQARFALGMDSQDRAARACLLAARSGIRDSENLREAQRELDADRVESAYALATALPSKSPLRKTEEFAEVRRRYVAAHQSYGERALRQGQADKAKREASLILRIPGISTAERKAAKRLQSKARRVASEQKLAPPTPESEPEPAPKPVSQTVATKEPKSIDTLEQARACLARGDNPCVIRLLENGGAKSASGLALLIETYRATGNQAAARRHMRSFVSKYPSNPRADRYRDMLGGS